MQASNNNDWKFIVNSVLAYGLTKACFNLPKLNYKYKFNLQYLFISIYKDLASLTHIFSMKNTLIFFLLFFTLPTFSQDKTRAQLKAEKNFVKVIREIANKYPTNYSTDEGSTLTKPYLIQITNEDELQMEWDFKDADILVRIIRTIKISDITSVYLDYNMGFYSEESKVVVNYNNKYNKERPNYTYNYHLFEIAKVGDGKHGEAIKLKLEKALDDLLLFYKKE